MSNLKTSIDIVTHFFDSNDLLCSLVNVLFTSLQEVSAAEHDEMGEVHSCNVACRFRFTSATSTYLICRRCCDDGTGRDVWARTHASKQADSAVTSQWPPVPSASVRSMPVDVVATAWRRAAARRPARPRRRTSVRRRRFSQRLIKFFRRDRMCRRDARSRHGTGRPTDGLFCDRSRLSTGRLWATGHSNSPF